MKTKLNFLVIFTLLVTLLGASTSAVKAMTPVETLTISPETLDAAAYTAMYSQQLTAAGGTEPYTFTVLDGSLPNNMTLSAGGLLSGYPDGAGAEPGIYTITIQVTDSLGALGSRGYDFEVIKGTPVVELDAQTPIYWGNTFNISAWVKIYDSPSSYTTPAGTVDFTIDGTPVSECQAVAVNDMVYYQCPVTMDLSLGEHSFEANYTPAASIEALYNSVPSGMSTFTISPTIRSISGVIFRDDDQDGIYDVGVEYNFGYPWKVNLDKECDGTVDYTKDNGYNGYQFIDVPAPYCYRISVDADPGYQQTTVLADFTLTETVYDMHIGFYYPTITVSPSEIPAGSLGIEYSQTFSANGGTGPYTFSYWGTLPIGLTLSEDGVLSGIPTLAGDYLFTVQAQDANLATGYNHYHLLFPAASVFTFTPSANPSAPGDPVTFTITASGTAYDSDLERQVPPMGVVTFYDGENPIEGCTEVFLNWAIGENAPLIGDFPATCTTSALTTGTHQITADFSNFTTAFSPPTFSLTQTVQPLTSADLSISMTDSKDPVKRGTSLVYTLTARNAGPDAAQSVSIVDTLDPNTTFVTAKAPRGWKCTYANPVVTCTGASLTSGRSAIIKITVRVSKTTTVGAELSNTANVTSLTLDPVLTNNSASQTTRVVK